MSNLTNAEVIAAARRGEWAESSTGNLRTTGGGHGGYSYGSWAPDQIKDLISEHRDEITQVIYSYSTPIAWKHGDVWVYPRVSYTTTTSCKHQSILWKLPNLVSIPEDCGLTEYLDLLAGRIEYRGGKMVKGSK